jgi:hypothetical protein
MLKFDEHDHHKILDNSGIQLEIQIWSQLAQINIQRTTPKGVQP